MGTDLLADCRSEVDQLVAVLGTEGPVSSVLDLGTGAHADLLAAAGFPVVRGTLDEPSAGSPFDAVIMMGSALGSRVTDEACAAAIHGVSERLRPGGLFLFDFLDGTAVLRRAPRGVFTPVTDGDTQIVRSIRGSVDAEESTYRMEVQLWRLAGDQVVDRIEETRLLRYFLPRELQLLLDRGGLRLLDSIPIAGGQLAGECGRLAWARHVGGS
jgi:hypothetical protein